MPHCMDHINHPSSRLVHPYHEFEDRKASFEKASHCCICTSPVTMHDSEMGLQKAQSGGMSHLRVSAAST